MNDEIITSYLLGKKAGGGGTPPVYQDKEITITSNGEQTITKDSGYDALNSVALTVNVPEPSGKITITQNGTDIDVKDYSTADVSVPAGVDINDYFNSNVEAVGTGGDWQKLIKKFNNATITGTSMVSFFGGYNAPAPIPNLDASSVQYFDYIFRYVSNSFLKTIDLSGWTFSNKVYSFGNGFDSCSYVEKIDLSSLGEIDQSGSSLTYYNMFAGCNNLKEIDLSNFNYTGTRNCNFSGMFANDTALEKIDMSSFNFAKITNKNNMFDGVPTNCLILVKDQDQVDWFTTNFPSLTNVQIKS